jgi:tetratricopeptide (TPR) repeat protein
LSGEAILSSCLSGVGLLAFARYLQDFSSTTSTTSLLQAEHLLRRATLRNSANVSALRGLGLVSAAQGREDEAIAAWQTAGGMMQEFIQRGEQARSAKRYEEALAWYDWAAMVESGQGDPAYYAGLVHEELGQWNEALRAYEQAIELGTFSMIGQSSPHYRLGVIYQRRLAPPRLDEALAAYDAAIALGDFNTDAEAADSHYHRGVTYSWEGRDPRLSMREYQRAIDLNPRHKWAYLKLAEALYQANGDIALAERKIERALSLWPADESRKWPYRFLGDIYKDAGLMERAIAAYREALRLDSDDERVKEILDELVDCCTEVDIYK